MRVAVALVVVAAVGSASTGMAAPGDGSGSVLAFGANGTGQLGSTTNNGTLNPNPTPTLVTMPSQVGPVTQISAGGYHSLAVTSSGQLYAFGDNQGGELGITTNSGTFTPNPTPALVTLPGQNGPVTQISAGSLHSLAVTSSGQLYAFGDNFYGQLGNTTNNTTSNANPTPTLVTLPGQVGSVARSAGGSDHSLIATSSGQLYAFGNNLYGQLGRTTNSGMNTANPVPALVGLPGQVGPVTLLAAGRRHSLAATSSGQLYAFGSNEFGQLGNTTNNTTTNPNPTPTMVTLPGQAGPVTQIAAGDSFSLAVTSSGQLYAFGQNTYGQLGNSTNNGNATPNPTPTLVTLPGRVGEVTQVAAGNFGSLAVTSSGQLYAFGVNFYGALGSATNSGTATPNPTPMLADIAAGTTIDAVARGAEGNHSLVLVANLAIATGALPSAQAGTPYQATVQAAGGTAPMRWSAQGLPAGLTIDPASGTISGTPSAAGSSSPKITLTDTYGLTVSQTIALTVNTATGAPPPTGLANEPKLTALKQSVGKWLLGSKLPQLAGTIKPPVKKAGVPVGTTFSFTLDQAARVTLTFRHTAIGRRVAGKCVAKASGNASKPRCTRTLTDGALSMQARKGTNNLRFEGRLTRLVKLKPGSHTVAITAASTAGKKSLAKTLRFTILPS